MSEPKTQVAGYQFDSFFIDAANRQLWREGEPVALNSKYFDVLLMLVSHSGQLVEKQRIFDEVWSGVFVTDSALTQCIKEIRRALGDDASAPRYIKTVPKHGYIFIANAVEADEAKIASRALSEMRATINHSSSLAKTAQLHRPYKFLDYYTERDAELFFGREQEIEALCSQVIAHRSFILHGRSGVGKSSLLRAGLLPRLKAAGHQVFVIRSFTDPVNQMASALRSITDAPHSEIQAKSTGEQSIEAMLRKLAREQPRSLVIFFLDQFEEFFSLLDEEARAHLIETVATLFAQDALPFHLVFALREDVLAEMSQIKCAIPEIFHHEYRLKRLSREQAARAITEPAKAVGCLYEPELVARLLDDLSDGDSIDPPQLQIVCDNLYDSKDNGALTLAIYERLGAASQILAGYLERVLRRFNARDLHAAKQILTAMISAEGERLVLRARELEARAANRSSEGAALTARLIEELVAARVVRRRNQDGEAWLELAHEVLTAEVSRWLTADEVRLKQARAVIERAMENYLAHGLVIDADALDLILPFGEQLALTGEEADLLLMSALNRSRAVAAWLVESSPQAAALIKEAINSNDPDARLRAIEAAALLRSEEMKELLARLALWDADLTVRKTASIALADWLGVEAQELFSEERASERAGLVRRAVTLAMIRDYEKRLVQLARVSLPVSVLIVGGLMWVRLRRGGAEIVREGLGGTIGGAASGFIGGLILAIGLATARHATAFEGLSLALVLISLGFFIGAVGGFGVSFGMIAAARVTYRHSRWWSVAGGAAGGAIVGGSSKLLGVDTVRALFGRTPDGITGAMEGAVIGLGLTLGVVLVCWWKERARAWQKILGASLGAMCAGVLLTVIGGNLFSGSLEIVARMFSDSQIRMEPLASFFGEVHFGRTSQVVMGALEGLMFGAGVMSGIEMAARGSRTQEGEIGGKAQHKVTKESRRHRAVV
ncbi:MAG TPA: winged helix-turn-helix domain-containing protein [Blastocatellia bacterium]|nr:winged helix-turn-helix domain-containing protein [Blastocatellia bacterium]